MEMKAGIGLERCGRFILSYQAGGSGDDQSSLDEYSYTQQVTPRLHAETCVPWCNIVKPTVFDTLRLSDSLLPSDSPGVMEYSLHTVWLHKTQ
jgi:hypothetical protein